MDELVAATCQVLLGSRDPDVGRAWSPDDWARLASFAHEHGVASLLCYRFALGGWPTYMPPPVRDALRAEAYASRAHNLRLTQTLATIVAELTPLMPIVVLKGAALGATLYEQPALRPLSDLDVLVPAEQIDVATARVRGLGFRMLPAMAPELAPYISCHHALVGGAGAPLSVELHWSLTGGSAEARGAPVDWFWQQTQRWPDPNGNPAVLCLSPTAHLLYAAAHLVLRHGNAPARLIWLYDLHLLISRAPIDWALLVEQARMYGWSSVVRAALDQAYACFATPVSPWVREQLDKEDSAPAELTSPAGTYHPRSTWWDLAQVEPLTRLRLFLRVLFPSRAYLRANYWPKWGHLWPLAYPYRWFKPFSRTLRAVVRRPS